MTEFVSRIARWAAATPNVPAVVSERAQGAASLSYGELYEQAKSASSVFSSIPPSAPILFVLERGPLLVSLMLGGLLAGHYVAPVDVKQGLLRLNQYLELSGTMSVVADAAGRKVLSQIDPHRKLEILDAEDVLRSRYVDTPGHRTLADGGVVLFTSGSTGVPKGVRISALDIDERLRAEQAWFGLDERSVVLGVLPITFDVGLTQLFGSLWAGSTHVFGNSWLPKDLASAINRYKVTGLALSPVVWNLILRSKERRVIMGSLDGLSYVTLSGGGLALEKLQIIAESLNHARFLKTYGQTEMFRIASLDVGQHPDKIASVGRPYYGVDVAVVGEDGHRVSVGEIGEIVAWGMGLMEGYISEAQRPSVPIESAEPLKSVSRDLPEYVHHTGDFGSLDEDGFLYISGRRDEMIKVLDRRIYPADVASLVRRLLQDETVEVVAVPGEDPYLVVFSTLDSDESEAITLAKMRSHLGHAITPRRLIRLRSYPHTENGKLALTALRAIAQESLVGESK